MNTHLCIVYVSYNSFYEDLKVPFQYLDFCCPAPELKLPITLGLVKSMNLHLYLLNQFTSTQSKKIDSFILFR